MSDPDLSGASDKDTAKKGQQQKAGKLDEPAKPADGSQSEGKYHGTCHVIRNGTTRISCACDWLQIILRFDWMNLFADIELSKDKTKPKTLTLKYRSPISRSL